MIQRKLSEDDLTIPVLYILYTRGAMNTSSLKRNILAMLKPSGSNLDPLENRNDTKITQIIRNIISHRNDSFNNIIRRGLVDYNSSTGVLSITQSGIQVLDNYIISNIVDNLS